MPYIKKEDREQFKEALACVKLKTPKNSGELNYLITKICHLYFEQNLCYQSFNDIMGALEGAKLELYRRKIAKYEELKIIANGDV